MRPVARVPFRIESSGGIVRGDIRIPEAPGRDGSAFDRSSRVPASDAAIVVCHGFKGFKDWGFFPSTCEALVTRVGCPVVGFNFSGSGVGADPGRFSQPQEFATNTFSREVSDLEAVLTGLASGRLGKVRVSPPARIGILGHSRGAIAASLVGSRRPEVVALAVWGGLSRPERYAELFPPDADADHVVQIRNMRTGEVLPLGRAVVDDLREHGPQLDPLGALRTGGPPLLVVHGELDEAVPVSDGRAYAEAATTSQFLQVDGAGHTFEVRHPYSGSTPAFEQALDATAGHFRRHLATEN